MEFTLYEDVGFIFKTCDEVAQLEIYSKNTLGEGGTLYKPKHIVTIGDKSKVKRWKELIKGEGYISAITLKRELMHKPRVPPISITIKGMVHTFEASAVKIICTETREDYETITEYDSEGVVRTTNFFNRPI